MAKGDTVDGEPIPQGTWAECSVQGHYGDADTVAGTGAPGFLLDEGRLESSDWPAGEHALQVRLLCLQWSRKLLVQVGGDVHLDLPRSEARTVAERKR